MSTIGIALGVAALITVLSVMNGFGNELRARILGAVSHVNIESTRGYLQDWEALAARISAMKGVTGVAPYVEGQGMLTSVANSYGVVVRGVIPETEEGVADFGRNMKDGAMKTLQAGEYGVVVGSELAWRLGLEVGSRVQLLSSRMQLTPAGMFPRARRFTVVGIFELGVSEYDGGMALIHIEDARRLYLTGDGVSGVRLRLEEMFDAPAVRRSLVEEPGTSWRVRDWTQEHATFFRALRIEKIAMFIIMTLMVAVAAFNIVSMLVMQVQEKHADIAILRTLGMSPAGILGVFMIQGSVLGAVGTVTGALGGVLIARNIQGIVSFFERALGAHLFTPDIYYNSALKADLHWVDVAVIVAVSLVVTIVATLYPAREAARTIPARALRYE